MLNSPNSRRHASQRLLSQCVLYVVLLHVYQKGRDRPEPSLNPGPSSAKTRQPALLSSFRTYFMVRTERVRACQKGQQIPENDAPCS